MTVHTQVVVYHIYNEEIIKEPVVLIEMRHWERGAKAAAVSALRSRCGMCSGRASAGMSGCQTGPQAEVRQG